MELEWEADDVDEWEDIKDPSTNYLLSTYAHKVNSLVDFVIGLIFFRDRLIAMLASHVLCTSMNSNSVLNAHIKPERRVNR